MILSRERKKALDLHTLICMNICIHILHIRTYFYSIETIGLKSISTIQLRLKIYKKKIRNYILYMWAIKIGGIWFCCCCFLCGFLLISEKRNQTFSSIRKIIINMRTVSKHRTYHKKLSLSICWRVYNFHLAITFFDFKHGYRICNTDTDASNNSNKNAVEKNCLRLWTVLIEFYRTNS